MHKPEPMHEGVCPVCGVRRICVLLTVRRGMATRSYFIRSHRCGRRLVPVPGTLKVIRPTPARASRAVDSTSQETS
jgi:hypothetical protein